MSPNGVEGLVGAQWPCPEAAVIKRHFEDTSGSVHSRVEQSQTFGYTLGVGNNQFNCTSRLHSTREGGALRLPRCDRRSYRYHRGPERPQNWKQVPWWDLCNTCASSRKVHFWQLQYRLGQGNTF